MIDPADSRNARSAAARAGLLLALGLSACSASATPTPASGRATRPAARDDGSEALVTWREGARKAAIVEFIARVSDEASPDYVPSDERIAVFDNDGTLWAERPYYFELQFALDRAGAMASAHPAWRSDPAFAALLDGDMERALAADEHVMARVVMATHGGMTPQQFRRTVDTWLDTARHPRFARPYTDLVYAPMVELLDVLADNGFTTYIVSGGEAEFMRAWADDAYGIPPARVIGSTVKTDLVERDGELVLLREPKVDVVDDGPGKPVAIDRVIGTRPILAFGNSDGDHEMLRWVAAGPGPRLVGLVHHTDSSREWAYDRDSKVGRLDEALDDARAEGWLVVDMAEDWNVVFAFEGNR